MIRAMRPFEWHYLESNLMQSCLKNDVFLDRGVNPPAVTYIYIIAVYT